MGRDFGQIRMRDVAERAGVSVITVSRAMRTPSAVSDEARARIDSAVRELGYVPNGVASSLSLRRSNVVSALIPNIRNALHATMVQGLSDVLHEANLQLMVATVGQSQAQEEAVLLACLQQRPCAVVLYHTLHSENTLRLLRGARVPVVEVGDLTRSPVDTVVSYSNRDAGQAITALLAELGCRTIAIVLPPVSDNAAKRFEGYEAALRHLGLPQDARYRYECVPGYDHGAEVIAEIVAREPSVDAVLFSSLSSAVGAWFECERRGWGSPRLTIASFDDPELTGWRGPRLTVVRLPRYEVGQQAARIILQRLRGETPSTTRLDLGFELRRLGDGAGCAIGRPS